FLLICFVTTNLFLPLLLQKFFIAETGIWLFSSFSGANQFFNLIFYTISSAPINFLFILFLFLHEHFCCRLELSN
ncbi:hypothetical protein, partial [Petrimonas sp.]|uniref:hypothetical protein n=1 Tax=Petrimonas sp. TaxID=2023866 RepID=UPI003322DBA8